MPVPNFDRKPKKLKRVKQYIRCKNSGDQSQDDVPEWLRAQLLTGNYNDIPVLFKDCQKSHGHETVKPQKQSTPKRSESKSGDEMFYILNHLFRNPCQEK